MFITEAREPTTVGGVVGRLSSYWWELVEGQEAESWAGTGPRYNPW